MLHVETFGGRREARRGPRAVRLRPAALPPLAHDDKTRLAAALDWLGLAQDVRDGRSGAGGISAGWSFEDGWLSGYPETTGYTIETFIEAAEILQRSGLVGRAHRMIDWEFTPARAWRLSGHYGEPGNTRHPHG